MKVELDEELRRVVSGLVERFGDLSGYELEVETLRMLGIKPFEKDQYFGREMREILGNAATPTPP
nr:hypothetical protein [Candidatus Freyrarchaeum guaymaensis]